MCIFTGKVEEVFDTRLFGRLTDHGTQYLAYAMSYKTDHEVAMVLPVPIKRLGFADETDQFRFITLDKYPDFFSDLLLGVPDLERSVSACPPQALRSRSTLEVHEVGAYHASFVPTIGDFDRLDARFRLTESAWKQLPSQYQDYGFAVFQLRVSSRGEDSPVHPMAFEFASAMPETLFFPTIHLHDADVHAADYFDHILFYQGDGIAQIAKQHYLDALPVDQATIDALPWDDPHETWGYSSSATSADSAQVFINIERTQGLVDADLPCHATILEGYLQNRDTLLTAQSTEN